MQYLILYVKSEICAVIMMLKGKIDNADVNKINI